MTADRTISSTNTQPSFDFFFQSVFFFSPRKIVIKRDGVAHSSFSHYWEGEGDDCSGAPCSMVVSSTARWVYTIHKSLGRWCKLLIIFRHVCYHNNNNSYRYRNFYHWSTAGPRVMRCEVSVVKKNFFSASNICSWQLIQTIYQQCNMYICKPIFFFFIIIFESRFLTVFLDATVRIYFKSMSVRQ